MVRNFAGDIVAAMREAFTRVVHMIIGNGHRWLIASEVGPMVSDIDLVVPGFGG